jgi:hypothetical protein
VPALPRREDLLLDADADLGRGAEHPVDHRGHDRDRAAAGGAQERDGVDRGGDHRSSGQSLGGEARGDVDPGEDGAAWFFIVFFFGGGEREREREVEVSSSFVFRVSRAGKRAREKRRASFFTAHRLAPSLLL